MLSGTQHLCEENIPYRTNVKVVYDKLRVGIGGHGEGQAIVRHAHL